MPDQWSALLPGKQKRLTDGEYTDSVVSTLSDGFFPYTSRPVTNLLVLMVQWLSVGLVIESRWFDSRPGRYQEHKVNSAFHPSWVGKQSTSLHGWG